MPASPNAALREPHRPPLSNHSLQSIQSYKEANATVARLKVERLGFLKPSLGCLLPPFRASIGVIASATSVPGCTTAAHYHLVLECLALFPLPLD
jgi:hypothetical protein